MLLIFDENFPPDFVKAFALLEGADRRSNLSVDVIFSNDLMGGSGSSDEEIIMKASERGAVIVTHDSDFKRIKHYKPLLIKHKVGYIYFKVPKGKYQFWDIIRAFINKWDEIKLAIAKSEHPFAFEISKTGHLVKLPF